MKNAGFSIDNTRWLERFDQTYKNSRVKWRSDIEDKIKHIKMSEVQSIFQTIDKNPFYWPAGDLINTDDLAQNAKTAIYVLARQAGEGGDRKVDKGDYLVDDIELANLKTLANYYDNLILVIIVAAVLIYPVLMKSITLVQSSILFKQEPKVAMRLQILSQVGLYQTENLQAPGG